MRSIENSGMREGKVLKRAGGSPATTARCSEQPLISASSRWLQSLKSPPTMSATPLEAMVRHVVMADRAERPAREQRVAVLAVARHGVGAVGDLVAFGREVVGLGHLRPTDLRVRKLARLGAVHSPRF